MKRKLSDRDKERLKGFLETHSRAIINAELQTYKETPVSTHVARLHIFTPYTVGTAEIQLDGRDAIDKVLAMVIADFKKQEKNKIISNDEASLIYQVNGGSYITALIFLFPSTSLKIGIKEINDFPEPLRTKALNKSISPEDILDNTAYSERYKHMVGSALNVHYASFYTSNGAVYTLIEHNDEVLDMPQLVSFGHEGEEDTSSSLPFDLKKFIEVE